MKKIIPILLILLLIGTFLISGCSSTSTTTDTTQFDSQLGIDDIGNELAVLDADDSDFDLSDLDNVESDLGDL